MAASASWRGAVDVGGFPVNIALWPTVKSTRGESFRTLAPNGQPISQFYKDSEGNEVSRDECSKGIEVGKGEYHALTELAVEQITSREKDTLLEASYFAPIDTLPTHLATKTFYVRHDEKVPGADKSANVLWNGLRANGLAYVTQATLRSGSPDVVLAIWATDYALYAASFPFSPQLYVEPAAGEFTDNAEAADLFMQVVGEVKPFNLTNHTSTYSEKRAEVIEAVLEGREPERPAEVTASPDAPDLMAALKAKMAVAA